MKRLLTFIYGILIAAIGVIGILFTYEKLGFNFHLITFLLSVSNLWIGFSKMDKATE